MKPVSQPMKIISWLNIKTGKQQWGVDIKVNGEWCHLSENGKPCIYDTKKEAKQKITNP